MPYQSFESLLKRFPYFLDKKTTSNFSKSEKVFNDEFKKVYNNLYDVYLASKLNKHLLIWKVQEEPYNYEMYFHVSLPYLKSVTITKIAEEIVIQEVEADDGAITTNESTQEIIKDIYTETYEYTDFVDCFEYLHSDTSQNIIPDEKYLLSVETWDEYTVSKGFPENQIELGDEYDHDYSIDKFGEFFNVPRRSYTVVDNPDDYKNTIPSYDNQPTEDDYHYLQRLLYYVEHLNDTPLPVLEIFKLFSLSDAELLNRERLICRMIDTTRHSTDNVYNREWEPEVWEHKDQWCTGATDNLFLFANVNNSNPIQGQTFVFDFKVLNSFAKEVYNTDSYELINDSIIDESEDSWIIVPYINGVAVSDTFLESKKKWQLTTADINEEDATFNFKCFTTIEKAKQNLKETENKFIVFDDDLISEEILIKVRGCNSADYYVSTSGDDNNDGTSKETAFKTVTKAVSMVEGEKNIIALLDGTHQLQTTAEITENTTILSCPEYNPVIDCENDTFFKISQDKELTLQNIHLKYHCRKMYAEYTVFRNNNNLNYSLNVYVDKKYGKIDTYTSIDMPTGLVLLNKYNLTGNIRTGELYKDTGSTTSYKTRVCSEVTTKNKETNYPTFAEKLSLYIDDTLYASTTCDTKGDFSFKNIPTPSAWKDLNGLTQTFKVVHEDTEYYCKSEAVLTRGISRVQPVLTLPSLLELVIYEEGVIHAEITTPTTVTPQPNLTVEVYNKAGNKVHSQGLSFTNAKTSLDIPFTSETPLTEEYTFKLVADNTYLSASSKIKIIVAQLAYEIVDYPELINTGDFSIFDNLPSSLSGEMVLALDKGDNQLIIVDNESEIPSGLGKEDIVYISSVEEESDINIRVRDKKEGE